MVLSQHFLRWLLNFWKLNDSTDIIHFVGLISSELMFELDLFTMNLSPTRTIWPYFCDFSLHHNTPQTSSSGAPPITALVCFKNPTDFPLYFHWFFSFQTKLAHYKRYIQPLTKSIYWFTRYCIRKLCSLPSPPEGTVRTLSSYFWLPWCCCQHLNHGPKRSITTLSHDYRVKLLH